MRGDARRALAFGSLLTAVGLAIGALAPVLGSEEGGGRELGGGLVVLAGWAVLAWGIHRFGREVGDA